MRVDRSEKEPINRARLRQARGGRSRLSGVLETGLSMTWRAVRSTAPGDKPDTGSPGMTVENDVARLHLCPEHPSMSSQG